MIGESLTIVSQHSGYIGNSNQWSEFLKCWYSKSFAIHQEMLKETPDLPYLPILNKYKLDVLKRQPAEDINVSINKVEKALGLILPKSYKDFLLAYQPPLLEPQETPWGEVLIGMYAPSQIGRIADLDPKLLELVTQHSIETEDEKYFMYGIKQDSAYARTCYIEDEIIIGRYGDAMYEILTLYPQVKTIDGEMQAGLRHQTGEFRAPSFAELMRQISILETLELGYLPPYSQKKLKGTCAEKLLLENVWWE